jgi:hypothetical protein
MKYPTRYGVVNHSSICKDDWDNIQTIRMGPSAEYKLQISAIRSLRAVAKDVGGPWQPKPVRVTGTWRSCAYQWQLYRSDPSRYAHPNTTLHTQGLAIDVHTDFLTQEVKQSLLSHGWKQARPTDEPWHFSFRLKA